MSDDILMEPVPVLALLAVFFSSYLLWRLGRKVQHTPPGPGLALPLLGHIPLLMTGQPHVVLGSLARKFGPVIFLRFGVVPVVVVSSIGSACEFLKVHDKVFSSRPRFSAWNMLFGYDGKDMVFAPYGASWKRLRRFCAAEIFTSKSLSEIQLRRLVRNIQTFSRDFPGVALDVRARLREFTFSMACRMVTGKCFEADEAKEFTDIMEEAFKLGSFPIRDFLPYRLFSWLNAAEDKRIEAITVFTRAFVEKVIEEQENGFEAGGSPQNFLSLLIKLRKEDPVNLGGKTVAGLVINLLQAATDTSSVSLEWTLAELLNHPSCMAKVRDEIQEVVDDSNRMVEEADLPKLHYLHAVITESLRLHPPGALLLPRESSEDCTVRSFHIPRGSMLLVNAYAIGRDPSVWEHPLEFKPERFRRDGKLDVRWKSLDHLIPFGAGSRACPGASIALTILELTLANLVHAFEWRIPPGRKIDTQCEEYGLTVSLANKLEAVPLCRTCIQD